MWAFEHDRAQDDEHPAERDAGCSGEFADVPVQ